MPIDLGNRVALVTGAGRGLGRTHALALAAAGARVVVNDLAREAADAVAAEIVSAGGEAFGHAANVADHAAVEAMAAAADARFGAVDILVANAGILRDKSFARMSLEDFRLVVDVHLMGSVNCVKALWDGMRERNYGRIVLTTSSSGLYGNFGQSNYGAAKMALVGLMQTLGLEGAKNNVRVNCLAPTAATEMTAGLLPPDISAKLGPEAVSPAVVALAGVDAPNRQIVLAGAGTFGVSHLTMTRGLHLGTEGDVAGRIAARFGEITDRAGETVPQGGVEQGMREIAMAAGVRPTEETS